MIAYGTVRFFMGHFEQFAERTIADRMILFPGQVTSVHLPLAEAALNTQCGFANDNTMLVKKLQNDDDVAVTCLLHVV